METIAELHFAGGQRSISVERSPSDMHEGVTYYFVLWLKNLHRPDTRVSHVGALVRGRQVVGVGALLRGRLYELWFMPLRWVTTRKDER